ncbi:alpha-N-acetylgalactosamine-specific lectin-like [Branchiostoma floridae x Branchiostoma japonicum]
MPRDADTNAFIVCFLKSVDHEGKAYYWFGLQYQRRERRFEWLDGTALGEFSSWAPFQRHKRYEQSCVKYGRRHPIFYDRTWFEASCLRHYRFICQVTTENTKTAAKIPTADPLM